MDKIKIYRDSKEIPVRVIERIETTGDFFYMIKSYDYGDEPNADISQLKKQFEDIFESFIIELNSKHIDIVQYGKIASATLELELLIVVHQYISLKIQEIKLSSKINREVDLSLMTEMLSTLKIQKHNDLSKQLELIEAKINKNKNIIDDAKARLADSEKDGNKEKQSIYDILINVGIILEKQLNPDVVTLYELGKLQELAIKKIEVEQKNIA